MSNCADCGNGNQSFGLFLVASIYLLSLLLSASNFGSPFPFLGSFYQGTAGESLTTADCLINLYLFIGILKRQRLTLWLLLAYNLYDICNALLNYFLIPNAEYGRLAGGAVPEGDLLFNTFAAVIFVLLMSLYLFRYRDHFDNKSPYLF